ncbi:MAG: hydantoinase/oxoprolinase family protein [Gammaproteobacteria bacterium]
MRVGIDTGGTFTDFVVVDDDGGMRTHKVPSTPEAPERAILAGLAALGVNASEAFVVHGSTVATNAVLEGKGARTVFITNRGFGDTLTIGRQARPHLYDLQPPAIEPPVSATLCVETGGRITPNGAELEPLTDADLSALRATVERLAPEAVAISLLFSFVNDRHERRIADTLPETLFISRSSAVLPEYREYERGIATWLNARVGPVMAGYLGRLRRALPGARIAVMQSSAGTVSAEQAAGRAVHLLLSGPAGGAVGAAAVGAAAGHQKLLTFDMGGTSTDVALIDGAPRLTSEGRVAGFPVAIPMVDIHTIGAGGGSIAWCDAGGALRVGPQSAGATPGPACYGLGGTEPTVTDAHLLLGHLPAGEPLGGLTLDADAARASISRLAGELGLCVEEAARGILEIADEHMFQALRVISVSRGEDPRDYALFAFGGAGGLHVCSLAEKLGVTRALFPANAGVLSALGMLAAPRLRTLSRTQVSLLEGVDTDALDAAFATLVAQGMEELMAEGVDAETCNITRAVDLRYAGQSHTLEIPWDGADVAETFHRTHSVRFGHRLDLPVELVNLRATVSSPAPPLDTAGSARRLADVINGPAVVAMADSTLWLAPGWQARPDEAGNLALTRVE